MKDYFIFSPFITANWGPTKNCKHHYDNGECECKCFCKVECETGLIFNGAKCVGE